MQVAKEDFCSPEAIKSWRISDMLFSVLFSQSSSGELPAGQGNCWELPSELLNLYQHCRVSLMETLGFVVTGVTYKCQFLLQILEETCPFYRS